MRRLLAISLLLLIGSLARPSLAQEAVEERLYNFDDMLIDGAYRDPQGMFERSRTEPSFEGVLNLKRSFIVETEENAQEAAMQP